MARLARSGNGDVPAHGRREQRQAGVSEGNWRRQHIGSEREVEETSGVSHRWFRRFLSSVQESTRFRSEEMISSFFLLSP